MRIILTLLLTTSALPALARDCPEGQRLFDHAAGSDCVPVDPQRIVTLQDQNALLPLLELGVRPIASAGHVLPDGSVTYRRTDGFDTDGIAFVGVYGAPDREAVAAQAPDLVIASPWPDGAYELYSPIAPTVIIDPFDQPLEDALMQIADLVGRTAVAEALRAETWDHAESLRARLGDTLERASLSFLEPDLAAGVVYPENGTQAAGAAFRMLGLTRVPEQEAIAPGDWPEVSYEALGDHSGDVLFVNTYGGDVGAQEFATFVAHPIVAVLPSVAAGQVVRLDGDAAVGASWGKIRNFMDQIAAGLDREYLNLDLVAE